MEIHNEAFEFISTDGKTKISAVSVSPRKPRGVIVLAHGMAEHIDRYTDFANELAQHGFALVMHNHIGHYGSLTENGPKGYISDSNGDRILVNDTIKAYECAKTRFPNLPVFLFGHSMGSFIVRIAATKLCGELSGLIISGTGGPNPLVGLGLALIKAQTNSNGPRSYSKIVQKMAFGSYNKKLEGRTEYDWLSTDNKEVDKYVADEYCGFEFTVSAMGDLMRLIRTANASESFALKNSSLPILLFSGENDPVGNYSKGVRAVYERYKKGGAKDVTLKIYPNGRHEMLNEQNRYSVYELIEKWLEERL